MTIDNRTGALVFGELLLEDRIVEFNRNHIFMMGVLILFVGVQLRLLDHVVLNQNSSQFLAKKMGNKTQARTTELFQAVGMSKAVPRKVVKPPQWAGWCALAAGAVLVLHSLALRRPGG